MVYSDSQYRMLAELVEKYTGKRVALRSTKLRFEIASALLAISDAALWTKLRAEAASNGLVPMEEVLVVPLPSATDSDVTIEQHVLDEMGDDPPTRGADTLIQDALRRDAPPTA